MKTLIGVGLQWFCLHTLWNSDLSHDWSIYQVIFRGLGEIAMKMGGHVTICLIFRYLVRLDTVPLGKHAYHRVCWCDKCVVMQLATPPPPPSLITPQLSWLTVANVVEKILIISRPTVVCRSGVGWQALSIFDQAKTLRTASGWWRPLAICCHGNEHACSDLMRKWIATVHPSPINIQFLIMFRKTHQIFFQRLMFRPSMISDFGQCDGKTLSW